MRKIKKINGYLVVRFNDREKRLNEGTGLGSFGVIDAELYSGILDIDRDLMEFDGADTLEEAIDQARGLEAEQDVDEPQVKITIVKETDTVSSEEEIDPVSLFNAEKSTLKAVNENCTVPGLGDLITTQRLYGYTRALTDLGIVEISDERFQVDAALPPNCNMPHLSHEQHKDLQAFMSLIKEIEEYANQPSPEEPDNPERTNFQHPPSDHPTYPKIYALGMQLLKDCPENDCIIFRNTFQMVLETDEQLDLLSGFPRRWLSRRIQREYRCLEQMLCYNEAVRKYRQQHPMEARVPNKEGGGDNG